MKKEPKILIYDLETSPNLGYCWGRWEQNIIDFKAEWEILCFAYKWLGDSSVKTVAQPDFRNKNDKAVVKALWELFDEADVVIAHNGDAFDQKKARARFLFYGLQPPSPVVSIDTKKIAKRHFALTSNKLDEIGRYLKVGRKVKHSGFDLWLGCMAGKKASWREMIKYNKQDVILLEKVYLKLRPWIQNHPNMSFLRGQGEGCPNCGSSRLKSYGIRRTKATAYRRLRCLKCAAFSRVRVPLAEVKEAS